MTAIDCSFFQVGRSTCYAAECSRIEFNPRRCSASTVRRRSMGLEDPFRVPYNLLARLESRG